MAKGKDKKSVIQDITNRYRVTAREARDIVTAVSTLGRSVVDKNVNRSGVSEVTKKGKNVGSRKSASETRALATRNLAKQVGEVYTAATKGKSGTQSGQIKSYKNKAGQSMSESFDTPTKRKQGSKK
jgi:hypothetical protein